MEFNSLEEMLKLTAPGTEIRKGLDRIVSQESGALILLAKDENYCYVVSSGLWLDVIITGQLIAELAKMDGALVLDTARNRILYANAYLEADTSIPTDETGTRHKTADRIAKQLNNPVIAVSEERADITLYYSEGNYQLRDPSDLKVEVNQALLVVDQYKKGIADDLSELTTLELEGRVMPKHLANIFGKIVRMYKMKENVSRLMIELGNKREMAEMQVDDLMSGIERELELLIRDYSLVDKDTEDIKKKLLSFSIEDLKSTDTVMEPLMDGKTSDDNYLSPGGFRLLHKLPQLPTPVIEGVVDRFEGIENLLKADQKELEAVKGIAQERAETIKSGLSRMKEGTTDLEELGEED